MDKSVRQGEISLGFWRQRGVVFFTSPQMRRLYFTGFKLLLEHLGEEDEIITELFSSCGISQTSF